MCSYVAYYYILVVLQLYEKFALAYILCILGVTLL